MLKKRLIFTLLYDHGYFMLSRNFRLQRVGDLDWLMEHYDFARTATQIDELVLLNVERTRDDIAGFERCLQMLNDHCFVPITAGGGVRSIDDAERLLRNGADKILINSLAATNEGEVHQIASAFGDQSVVLGVDLRLTDSRIEAVTNCGQLPVPYSASKYLARLTGLPAGEWYLNSVSRDGTGQGFHYELLDLLPLSLKNPVILAGGASKPEHFSRVLSDPRVSALSTAHLFNFVGDGLMHVRAHLLESGFNLPLWNFEEIEQLKESLSE